MGVQAGSTHLTLISHFSVRLLSVTTCYTRCGRGAEIWPNTYRFYEHVLCNCYSFFSILVLCSLCWSPPVTLDVAGVPKLGLIHTCPINLYFMYLCVCVLCCLVLSMYRLVNALLRIVTRCGLAMEGGCFTYCTPIAIFL